ncbi:DgyrCDS382 [Dimorphilus gyrociliatus]|uniref:DgyrCDS382 n=1 Tax=Dimorphilus gyrociliatus TaxID=2664684 RepID=A0A7I8V5M1_9ANNE|nr:DgyrCDS382 [Dimorphilus gyrociliatus]
MARGGGGIQTMGIKKNMRSKSKSAEGESDTSESIEEPSSVRRLFPETWLCPDGRMIINAVVPDTITSWVATAFAMSETDGLGVAEEGAKVTVFKSFFIQLSLPYSVIRGEEFKLKVLVFNYESTQKTVKIHLKIPPNTFVARTGEKLEKEISNAWASKTVTVEPNSSKSVNFWIEPKALGNIPLLVMARGHLVADAIERNLLVEAEGSPEEYSKSTFLRLSKDGDSSTSAKFHVALPPPSVLVNDSQYISVTVIGDIMGKSMNSLESLIRMPYGCGEQNMINFVPNIVAMDYMTASGQVTESIKKKAIKYMTAGYQRELTYQRDDGSFSAFGNRDKSGSLWLTDYVTKSFIAASKYIFVDQKIIANSIQFIMGLQDKDGKFAEPKDGRVIHAGMQGGTSKGITLTAYTLATLIEASRVVDKSKNLIEVIDTSLKYLDNNAQEYYQDPYALAVLSYTYQLADLYHNSYKSTKADDVWNNLQKLANEEEGMKWWKTVKKEVKCPRSWCSSYNTAKASDVELAAYALLVYSLKTQYKDDIDSTLPVLRWMLSQTNEKGAFKSTQDTVVGLSALAKYSSVVLAGNEKNMKIKLSYGESSHNFNLIAMHNATILQQTVVPKDTQTISVEATGYGTAVVQMNVNYNIKDTEGEPPKLHSTLKQMHSPKGVQLKSCVKFSAENGEESGMVVTELNVLSGHFVDTSELLQEYGTRGLKRVESVGKKVNMYWDGFSDREECFELFVQRKDPVVNVQPAEIAHYVYYDVEERSSHMYSSDRKGFVLNFHEARLAACNDCGIEYVSNLKESNDQGQEIPIFPIESSSIIVNRSKKPNAISQEFVQTDFIDFKKRVLTFDPSVWYGKPMWLNPLQLARFGWTMVSHNLLKCSFCSAYAGTDLPLPTNKAVYDNCVERLKKSLLLNHNSLCSIRSRPCSESYLTLDWESVQEARDYLLERVTATLEVGYNLPRVSEEILMKLGLNEENFKTMKKIFEKDLPNNSDMDVIKCAVSLSLCGWVIRKVAKNIEIYCNMCNRQVALRQYYTLQDEPRPIGENEDSVIGSSEIASFETKRSDVAVQTTTLEFEHEEVQTEVDSNAWKKMLARKNSYDSEDSSTGLFSSNCRPFSPRHVPTKNGVFGNQSAPQSNIFYSSTSYNTSRSSSALEVLHEVATEEESVSAMREESVSTVRDDSNSNSTEEQREKEEKNDSNTKFDLHTILEESQDENCQEESENEDSPVSKLEKNVNFQAVLDTEETEEYPTICFEQSKGDDDSGSDEYEEYVGEYESLSNEDDIEDMTENDTNYEVIAVSTTSESDMENERNSALESGQDELDADFYEDDDSNSSEPNIPQVDGSTELNKRKRTLSSESNFSFKRQRTQMTNKLHFHPANEHRRWCPWIHSHVANSQEGYKGFLFAVLDEVPPGGVRKFPMFAEPTGDNVKKVKRLLKEWAAPIE